MISKDVRSASHAGDWYTDDGELGATPMNISHFMTGEELDSELSNWLGNVGPTEDPYPIKGCKAIIAPFVCSLPLLSGSQPAVDMRGMLIRVQQLLGHIRVSIPLECMLCAY